MNTSTLNINTDTLSSGEVVSFLCKQCGIEFPLSKSEINYIKSGHGTRSYCSLKCNGAAKITSINLPCAQCGKKVIKLMGQLKKSKSGNIFCSRSCSATYNNTHKKHGNRRSKLEEYLETEIRLNFKNLNLKCNDKEIINSELDFYFPDLRFAIELNGIFHYEPIYGEDKLERIQNNDNQKLIRCYEQGIELCIIDSSTCDNMTEKNKLKYKEIVFNIINKIFNRLQPIGNTQI